MTHIDGVQNLRRRSTWSHVNISCYLVYPWKKGHEPAEHCSADAGDVNKGTLRVNEIQSWTETGQREHRKDVECENRFGQTYLFAHGHAASQSQSQANNFGDKSL